MIFPMRTWLGFWLAMVATTAPVWAQFTQAPDLPGQEP